MAALLGLWSPK